jgi:hypothetical protein
MAKGPKDEDDPAGLRGFAKLVADMKWWGEKSKAEQPEPEEQSKASGSDQGQEQSQDQQPPPGDETSSEGETS